jgi:hypothetical protein
MKEIIIKGFSTDDFFYEIRKIIKEESKKEIQNESDGSKKEKYASRKETADALKISLPTLWDYTRRGLIKSVKIGNRVLYRWSDIDAALIGMENKKWR